MNYNKFYIQHIIEGLKLRKAGSRREEIIGLLDSLNQKNEDELELWIQTWIFPRLFNLIPELEKCRKDNQSEGDRK